MRHFFIVIAGVLRGVSLLAGCTQESTADLTSKCASNDDCGPGQACVENTCRARSSNGTGATNAGGAATDGGGNGAGSGATRGETGGQGGVATGSGGDAGSSGQGAGPGAGGLCGSACTDASPPGNGGSSGSGGGGAGGHPGGSGGAGGLDSGAPAQDGVGCGSKTCSGAEACCFSAAGTFPATPSTYTCDSGVCATATRVACDGPEDCHDQKCCRIAGTGGPGPGGRLRYACQDTCASAEIGCGGPGQCAAGEICCESTEGMGAAAHPTKTQCRTTCAAASEYVMCRGNADCPKALPTCIDSDFLPGFKRCY